MARHELTLHAKFLLPGVSGDGEYHLVADDEREKHLEHQKLHIPVLVLHVVTTRQELLAWIRGAATVAVGTAHDDHEEH